MAACEDFLGGISGGLTAFAAILRTTFLAAEAFAATGIFDFADVTFKGLFLGGDFFALLATTGFETRFFSAGFLLPVACFFAFNAVIALDLVATLETNEVFAFFVTVFLIDLAGSLRAAAERLLLVLVERLLIVTSLRRDSK
jgi:hypothetical protein